jgi:hypothetical protein
MKYFATYEGGFKNADTKIGNFARGEKREITEEQYNSLIGSPTFFLSTEEDLVIEPETIKSKRGKKPKTENIGVEYGNNICNLG